MSALRATAPSTAEAAPAAGAGLAEGRAARRHRWALGAAGTTAVAATGAGNILGAATHATVQEAEDPGATATLATATTTAAGTAVTIAADMVATIAAGMGAGVREGMMTAGGRGGVQKGPCLCASGAASVAATAVAMAAVTLFRHCATSMGVAVLQMGLLTGVALFTTTTAEFLSNTSEINVTMHREVGLAPAMRTGAPTTSVAPSSCQLNHFFQHGRQCRHIRTMPTLPLLIKLPTTVLQHSSSARSKVLTCQKQQLQSHLSLLLKLEGEVATPAIVAVEMVGHENAVATALIRALLAQARDLPGRVVDLVVLEHRLL